MSYEVLLHSETYRAFATYANRLRNNGPRAAGTYVSDRMKDMDTHSINTQQALSLLINTKQPQIFAESEVHGDGRDWTPEEISLLGDTAIAVPVTVYDDGNHWKPSVHSQPFEATLLFTAGALLRNGKGITPADWNRVVRNGAIDDGLFRELYTLRLFPALKFANDQAAKSGKRAFVTIPGVGCGQFAGKFHGRLAAHFKSALIALLSRHSSDLTSLAAVYFDPYKECSPDTLDIKGISLRTRPLLKSASPKPQLLQPVDYEEIGDDFSDCLLFSVVAWDHVSWPGNDFFVGLRSTDDGVKSAATSAMTLMTGISGYYYEKTNCYLPEGRYSNWEDVVFQHSIQINTTGNVRIYGE